MNKRAILVGISISVVFFLATAGAGAALLQTNVGSSMAEMNENGPMDPEKVDVPTWEIGSSWTYHHELDLEEEDGDMYVHIVEEMTYTVEAIEQHEQDGDVFYAYNLSLEGEVIDGDGEVEGYNVDVDGGEIVGYKICRVSDLAIVVDRQEREIDAVGGGFIGIDLWLDLNRIYQPPIENYDFPVSVDDLFWSNTTMIAEGRYEYDAGMIGSGEDTFEEVIDYRGESTIPYMENITVPAGDFETYYIHETVSGIEGDEDSGEMEIWYDPEVKSYVKQIEDIGVDDFELTMSQELIDHEVFETSNELSIDPSEQWIKDEVTITGQFPDYPDENVTIWIPEGAEPRDGWNTTTDGDGYFEKVIQVPVAEDMTETTLDFSSIGFVAELDEQEDELVVSTLVIYHDNSPVYSTPTDGAVISSLDPELRVLLGHDKGEDMNVTFYDASDHSEIGFQENVSSGNYSNITWEGLDRGTTYGWYAVADDDDEAYESEVWEFTTEGPNFQLSIVSPEDGENFVEGDLVTLDYEVENIGTEDNTQNISFEVFHEEDLVFEYNETVSLMAGDLYEGEFTWEADMLGEFTFKIVSEDDEEEVDLTILEEFDLTVNIQGEGTVEVDGDVVEDGWSDEYADGTEVTLEAFAEEDWNFVGWTGDHEGTEEEVTVVIDADKEVTANFEIKDYELTVNIEGEGSVEKEPDQEEYEHGTEVIVTATPEEGWLFVEWTGDAEGTEEKITVVMDQNKELTALFELKTYELTVNIEGEGMVEVDPDQEDYEYGTEVTLTATPEDGWYFEEWIGDHTGTEEEITVIMNENKDLTALFELKTYELTVNIDGEGTVEVDPDQEDYEYETEVTLTAIPDEGWEFVEWTGDAEGTEEEITVMMNENKELTAHFEEIPTYELTVEIVGEGEVEIDPELEEYDEGSEVTLTALPNEGWYFDGWTGDHEDGSREITVIMDDDKTLTANFDEVEEDQYVLTIDTDGGGTTDPEPGDHLYEEGEEVTVEAIPYEDSYFVEWTGDHEGTEEEITFVMDDDKELTAHFIQEFELIVDVEGEGIVEVDPEQEEYEEGTEVDLKAIPEEGWLFVGWTGDHEGTEEEITVVMDGHKEITAHFEELDYYELRIQIIGEGTVEVDPDEEEYLEGSEVTLTALPNEGWYFEGWTGDHEGTERKITLIMDDDKTLTANFDEVEEDQYVLTIDREGEGTTDPEPGDHLYEEGEEVTVEAFSEEGWLFVEWTGDAEGTEENITVVMDENKELTAHFIQEFELTVNIEGEGDVLVDPDEEVYLDGTEVTLTATPEEGWLFVEWIGDVPEGEEENEELTVIMNENKELTAHFIQEFELTVEVEGEGDVLVDPDEEVYLDGTEVTLTAIPDEGWLFVEWTGDYEGTEEEITIVVEADMHITAIFEEDVVVDTYTLTVDIEGEGEVAVDPEQDEYEEGTVVELTASPEEGWEFVEWTGDETGTDTTIEVTMDSDITITAHFEELEEAYFEVSIVSPEDGDEFEEGDEIVVEYEVMNTGVVTGEQDIELYVGGELVDTEEGVEIEPDGTYEGQFTFEVEEDGTIEIEVRGSDEGEVDTISLTISAIEDPDDPDDEDDDFPWWLIVVVLIIIAVIVVALLVLMKKEDKGDVLDEENYDEVYEEGYEEGYEEEYGQEPEDEVFTEEDEEF